MRWAWQVLLFFCCFVLYLYVTLVIGVFVFGSLHRNRTVANSRTIAQGWFEDHLNNGDDDHV